MTLSSISCKVEVDSNRASIAYADPIHAKKAISTPLPVLNNRFIKIYWDNGNAVPVSSVIVPYEEKKHHHYERKHPQQQQEVATGSALPPQFPPQFPPQLPYSSVTEDVAGEGSEQISPEELEKQKQEREKSLAHLKELQHQREELRKKQLEEIKKMTEMASTAQGKKKQFLVDQIKELTAAVEASLKHDQQRAGLSYTLAETVRALEQKAGEMGLDVPAQDPLYFKRKGGKSGTILDNRPRTLIIENVPSEATAKLIMRRFKSFGLIDEIDLKSDVKTITFATHDSAEKAKKYVKELKYGEDESVMLELKFKENNGEIRTADEKEDNVKSNSNLPAVEVSDTGKGDKDDEKDEEDEEEEEEEEGEEENWKRN